MNIQMRYFNIITMMIFVISSIINSGVCSAGTQDSEEYGPPTFDINATIMEINRNDRFMVIAEKEIHLLTQTQDNKMIWKTRFLDTSGHKISMSNLKVGDRVLVQGTKTATGKLEALSVTFVKTAVQPSKDTSAVNGNNSRSSSPVQLQGGVWTN